jgi:branched-chain amino acid transport system substrate-binding protein
VLKHFTIRFTIVLCFALMVLAGLSACEQAAPTFQNSKTIRIGFSESISGDFASDGAASRQGYELWADTVNKNGGLLGRQVQLVILPDDSTPDKVKANYQQLISVDHVDLVVGPFSTLLTKSASDIANHYGYAMVEGSGGGPSVFNRGLQNVFDVSLPVINNLVSFVLYVLSLPQDERPRTAAYATEDDPFTQPQVDLARQMLEAGGVKTVYYRVYPAATTKDYTPYANGVVQSAAQVTILGTLLPDVRAFINTFKHQNYNPQALIATAGPDAGSDFIKAVGGIQSTEGVFVPNGWYPQATFFQNAQMVQDYLTQYGGTPDAINADVAEAYSVGQVLEQAIEKNNSIDNTVLIRELHSDLFNTVQGPVKFDSTGQNTLALAYLFQWQKGSFIPVFPSFVASENPEFPKSRWP